MKNILILDTETFSTCKASNKKGSKLYNSQLPFEIAFFDPLNNKEYEYIILEFENNIKDNYFIKELKTQKIEDYKYVERKSFKDILLILNELSKDYDIWAYNSLFDEEVLKRAAIKLNVNYNLPSFNDIMVPFNKVVYSKEYLKWAKDNDRTYVYKSKIKPRKSAEDAYNYLLGNNLKDRVMEKHTALEDCKYEWEILKRLI